MNILNKQLSVIRFSWSDYEVIISPDLSFEEQWAVFEDLMKVFYEYKILIEYVQRNDTGFIVGLNDKTIDYRDEEEITERYRYWSSKRDDQQVFDVDN